MCATSLNQELEILNQELTKKNLTNKERLILSEKLRLEAISLYQNKDLECIKLKNQIEIEKSKKSLKNIILRIIG